MNKKNWSDPVVALSVIVCSLVLLAALAMALSGWRTGKAGRTLRVDFPDITGIHMRSQVRYAGAPAGSVSGIRVLTDEERRESGSEGAVRVTLSLDDSVPPIPSDTRVTLSSDSLLSDKFVALSAGTPGAPKLPGNALLKGAPAAGLDKLVNSVGPIADSIDRLVHSAENTLLGFDIVVGKTGIAMDTFKDGIGDALPRITELAGQAKATAESATQAIERIDALVADMHGPVKEDLEQLRETLLEMRKTLKSADRMITGTDRQIDARMAELSVVLQNLKVVTTNAKIMTRTLAEKPHRLIFGGKPPALPTERAILRSRGPVPSQ